MPLDSRTKALELLVDAVRRLRGATVYEMPGLLHKVFARLEKVDSGEAPAEAPRLRIPGTISEGLASAIRAARSSEPALWCHLSDEEKKKRQHAWNLELIENLKKQQEPK